MIVLGKTTAFNIYLSGNIHYLGGGLQCDSLVGQYNHGELFVKGETYAWLIYSDDMCMHFERFVAIQALINTSRPDISICSTVYNENNEVISVENYMPSTHRLCDIVRDDALEENKFVYADERNQLVDDFYTRFFEEGISLIDHNKSELYNYTNFRTDFIHIVNTLSELDEVKSDDGIYIDDGSIRHGFCRFVYEDKPYSQISTNIDNGFNIRMRTLLQRDTQEIMLVLEYLDEDDAVKYEWAADENTTGVEFFVARCAAYKAFEALKAHAARYDFNAENILKIIQSDHVPDNDMNGFSFDIDNTSVTIRKPYFNEDGEEAGNSIYVSNDDFSIFFKIEDNTPLVLYYDKDADRFKLLDEHTPSAVVDFYKEIWVQIINETEEQTGTDDDDPDRLTLKEFALQFGEHKMPDDLVWLFNFQYEYDTEISECFYLHTIGKTGLANWSEDAGFLNAFVEFATANGTGSFYAYWLIDTDLEKCPIVVFGDEGGVHVVAESTQKLIQLLTFDTEISVYYENVYFYKDDEDEDDEPSEYIEEFIEAFQERMPELNPIETDEEANEIIKEAKDKYQKRLNDFLETYGIETSN